MVRTANVYVDKQHGENCTCYKLDPIVFNPVIVSDDCPGRNLGRLDAVRELVAGEAVSSPRVRIVHPGGPGCLAQVWIDDEQVFDVTRIEIVMDANSPSPVSVNLTRLGEKPVLVMADGLAIEGDATVEDLYWVHS